MVIHSPFDDLPERSRRKKKARKKKRATKKVTRKKVTRKKVTRKKAARKAKKRSGHSGVSRVSRRMAMAPVQVVCVGRGRGVKAIPAPGQGFESKPVKLPGHLLMEGCGYLVDELVDAGASYRPNGEIARF